MSGDVAELYVAWRKLLLSYLRMTEKPSEPALRLF
jgi:hypothetical protein